MKHLKRRFKGVILAAGFVAFLFVCLIGVRTPTTGVYTTSAEANVTESTEKTETGAESVEETPDGDKTVDIDAFLEALKPYAEAAGVGNEYQGAVEAIKTAASKKQVTISTIASVAMLAVFAVFIIWKNTKDKKLLNAVNKLAKQLDDQIKGTNALIDETNINGKTEVKTETEVRQIKKAVSALAKMFSIFADRVNIGAVTKEEIRRESLNAQKVLEEEGADNVEIDKTE
ncbi:MAG: hypothetical protein IJ308_04015 [Clostridia bacterium]|nr:hypothetical protein [Clostridia bacterium]